MRALRNQVRIGPQVTILVDELRFYPTTLRCFKKGAAHLTFVAPSTVDDLHAFALSIGMQRKWFQDGPRSRVPHYDLTEKRRVAALAAGASFVPAKEQARARLEKGNQQK